MNAINYLHAAADRQNTPKYVGNGSIAGAGVRVGDSSQKESTASRGLAQRRRLDQENLLRLRFPVPLQARIAQLSKTLQGIVHVPLSQLHLELRIAKAVHLYGPACRTHNLT